MNSDVDAGVAVLAERSADALALGTLIARYPAFRFRRDAGLRGLRWIAERRNGADAGLHTIITADLAELHEALSQDKARHAR
jgi:hypothetical protein